VTRSDSTAPPAIVIEQYRLDADSIAPLAGGLINRSFTTRRHDGSECVLQRVSSIFPESIHDDIDAVTRHLARKGLTTPLLLPTASGHNRLRVDADVWRLMTRIPGLTHHAIPDDAAAHEAGRILGRFHHALADFSAPLASLRIGVHDTARHLGNLRQALEYRADHPAHAEVAALAERIFALAAAHAPLDAMPDRLVHGDPKISNVIFRGTEAVCLVDLDTLARMPVAIELGDALRSWSNLESEDAAAAQFSHARFEAVLAGYRSGAGNSLTTPERDAIPMATLTIATELAARFAADALNESYFGWDATRFESASAHNLVRASGQLTLAERVHAALPALELATRAVA
jgi:Ser/Thr protein kinase RdoA (MazF antagonist)